MSVLYGKIRLIPPDSTEIIATITDGNGNSRNVTVTQPCADIFVKGMEEYTISVNDVFKARKIVSCGRIVIINL